jgi:glucose/mannose-6-phosphate isomerase
VTATADTMISPSWDPCGAMDDVEGAAAQWEHAVELCAGMTGSVDGVTSVLVLGMGGSGIAGDVLGAVAAHALPLPVAVHKGFGLPAYVDERTLVIAVSYSGGTEETLDAVAEARRRRARLLAVTTGGDLGEAAAAAGFPVVEVPPGRQPRHSIGYLSVPLLVALGLDDGLEEAVEVLDAITTMYGRHAADSPLRLLGERFADGTVPVIYGTQGIADVAARRFTGQLQENAKLPAFSGTVPELGHNAIMGWEGPSSLVGSAGLVWLRDPAGDHPRTALRAELTDEIVAERFAWRETLVSQGTSVIARLASLLQQVDLVSLYAARARGIDPTPIRSIDRLKRELA